MFLMTVKTSLVCEVYCKCIYSVNHFNTPHHESLSLFLANTCCTLILWLILSTDK